MKIKTIKNTAKLILIPSSKHKKITFVFSHFHFFKGLGWVRVGVTFILNKSK